MGKINKDRHGLSRQVSDSGNSHPAAKPLPTASAEVSDSYGGGWRAGGSSTVTEASQSAFQLKGARRGGGRSNKKGSRRPDAGQNFGEPESTCDAMRRTDVVGTRIPLSSNASADSPLAWDNTLSTPMPLGKGTSTVRRSDHAADIILDMSMTPVFSRGPSTDLGTLTFECTATDTADNFQQALDELKKCAETLPDPSFEPRMEQARRTVFEGLQGRVKELSFDAHGCREVQTVLEHLEGPEQVTLVSELQGHVPEALESAHGNHVLQRCIELMRPSAVEFILYELSNSACSSVLARHRYGCRVLERLIEHFPHERLWGFLEGVISQARALCFDSFGNFVLQHLLEHGSDDQKRRIVEVLLTNLPDVATDQHACSVLDKAVSYTVFQTHLAKAVLAKEGLLAEMALSRGGCSATQSIFKSFEGNDLDNAKWQINARFSELQQTKHGKQLLSALGLPPDQTNPEARSNCRTSGGRSFAKGGGASQGNNRQAQEKRKSWGTARRVC